MCIRSHGFFFWAELVRNINWTLTTYVIMCYAKLLSASYKWLCVKCCNWVAAKIPWICTFFGSFSVFWLCSPAFLHKGPKNISQLLSWVYYLCQHCSNRPTKPASLAKTEMTAEAKAVGVSTWAWQSFACSCVRCKYIYMYLYIYLACTHQRCSRHFMTFKTIQKYNFDIICSQCSKNI